jgi:hypothetical protein
MPRIAGGRDIITQPLYDTQQYPAAGTAQPLTFFQTPKGQGQTLFGAAGQTKNLTDTNMRLAGSLPSPWTHEIFTIQLDILPVGLSTVVTIANDAYLVLQACNVVLEIGSKQFLEIPGIHLPAGAGLEGFSASTGTATSAHSGIADPRAVFALSRSITLLENENFAVYVTTPNAPTPVAAVNLRVYLGGELTRSVQ